MTKMFIFAMGLFLMASFSIAGDKGKKPAFPMRLADLTPESEELADYPETVKKGIEFLQTTDLTKLPTGVTKIDGDNVFANVIEYETRPAENVVSESHKRYIDVQFMVIGEEMMACVPYSPSLPILEPYHENEDYELYKPEAMPFWSDGSDNPAKMAVHEGELAIFAPGDVHATGVFTEKPLKIRKVVVKCLAK